MDNFDPCLHCSHVKFCNLYDITVAKCEKIDFDSDDIQDQLARLLSDCDDCDWTIAEHKYTDGLLDYGEPLEDEDAD